MKKILSIFVACLLIPILVMGAGTHVVSTITMTIAVTNVPNGGDTLTINTLLVNTLGQGSATNTYLLTWTTNTSPTSAQVLIGATGQSSATNLYSALTNNRPIGPMTIAMTATNALTVTGISGYTNFGSLLTNWGTFTAVTNPSYWSTPMGTNDLFPLDGDTSGTIQLRTAQSVATIAATTTNGVLQVSPGGVGIIVSETSFTGTRATAAFSAGQIINNGDNALVPPFTITNVCPAGRGGLIAFCALTTSNTTFTPNVRIKFYGNTNVTWYSNSQAAGTYFTNAAARLFNWDLPALAAETSGDSASVQDVSQWIPFISVDGNLYFYPIALSSATPIANQPYLLKIKVLLR